MSTIETGGSAFPGIKIVSGDNYNPPKQYHTPGMTLRDYFAAKAMQGFAADPDCSFPDGLKGVAAAAYDWADAMLAERSKK